MQSSSFDVRRFVDDLGKETYSKVRICQRNFHFMYIVSCSNCNTDCYFVGVVLR